MSDPVERFVFPMRLHYDVAAGYALSRHLRSLAEGRFVGQRCARCARVYMPPLGACSVCAVPTTDDVPLPDTGTVETFCIVNIPVRGQGIELPFACADVKLDGADTTFLALIQECAVGDVRSGMRVEAVWAPAAERSPSLASVRYFRPVAR
jgi:hypothetical protein